MIMPEMDGFETIRALADVAERRPIYLITGGPYFYGYMGKVISKQDSLSVVRVLKKPIKVSCIVDILNSHQPAT